MTTPLFPFETRLHRKALSVHRPNHTSVADPWVTDPDKVEGMHIWWEWDSDTAPTKYKAWLRNVTNTDWIFLSAWHLDQVYADGEVPVADVDGYFLPGTVEGGESGGGPTTVEVEDEGLPEGAAGTFDFVGDGVTANVSGGVATITIPGGAGNPDHTYAGYDTIGASTEAIAANSTLFGKKFTLSGLTLVTGIECYIECASASAFTLPIGAIYNDNSNTIGKLLTAEKSASHASIFAATTPRWEGCGLSVVLPAGDYWACVRLGDTGGTIFPSIYYDTGGSDRKTTAVGALFVDDPGSQSDSTRRYSIRISTIPLS